MIKANTLKVGDMIANQSELVNTGKMVWHHLRSVYKVKEIIPSCLVPYCRGLVEF